ncbi:MAG TPA: hydrogenase maturation protease [Spirochaetota bacterium]|nr:hydrogenase maturation protease [Spirochaetota bacterium]HSA16244.1 hydrogenase maturation protease [Spirochaetota bacterium]
MGKIVVYGYGNPGRQDDGLGPAMARRIGESGISGVETDSNYQLNIEDAAFIADADCVVFVDASLAGDGPFDFVEIGPSEEITFTTHSVSPQSVLALCQDLFGRNVRAYLMGIRGYAWDFAEGLSPDAEKNLDAAHDYLRSFINDLSAGIDPDRAITLH